MQPLNVIVIASTQRYPECSHSSLYWMNSLVVILNAASQRYSDCSHLALHRMHPLKVVVIALTQFYTEWSHSTLFWMQPLNVILIAFIITLSFCTLFFGNLLYFYYSDNITLLTAKTIERFVQLTACDVIKHIVYMCSCWFCYISLNTPFVHDMEHPKCPAVFCSLCIVERNMKMYSR
jgi:hypothetical protein